MKLESLTIIFENCEHCKVQADDITSISLMGITESLFGKPDNMRLRRSVKDLYLSIKNNDVDRTQRLCKYNDITGVELFFEFEASQFYTVEWAPTDTDYENSRQRVDQEYCDTVFIRVDDEKSNEKEI
jgi:hypothetical protein